MPEYKILLNCASPDDTVTDMGIYYFHCADIQEALRVTEKMLRQFIIEGQIIANCKISIVAELLKDKGPVGPSID